MVVEAEVPDALEPAEELPLAGDRGCVSGVAQDVAKGDGFRIEEAEFDVIPVVVDAGHDLDAGRGADWLRVGVVESDPAGRQGIEVRCLVLSGPVARQVLDPDVIGHDHDDVRALSPGGCGLAGENDKAEDGGSGKAPADG